MTPTDDTPKTGTPDRYDRGAAWNRVSEYTLADGMLAGKCKSAFFAELDAAAAWATRAAREECAKYLIERAKRLEDHAGPHGTIGALRHAAEVIVAEPPSGFAAAPPRSAGPPPASP